MKIELFSTIEELKADRIQREVSEKEIAEQKKFVSDLRKARNRNLKKKPFISL
ncbi:hypothetical protein JMN32_03605 [Fulvivirga sp. 29W222]|uniref:Uncharacterized protein n=1 Tax=Fulvivirga marina TaxID=2494733 RepID=A0A937FVM4_9BACT|nr:hypothetical protein [Fulvivirga marina]MBL6445377.1 hypothetical protein [Fulvivirga marina]